MTVPYEDDPGPAIYNCHKCGLIKSVMITNDLIANIRVIQEGKISNKYTSYSYKPLPILDIVDGDGSYISKDAMANAVNFMQNKYINALNNKLWYGTAMIDHRKITLSP